MNIYEARRLYSEPPMYSDEIGRYISKSGATYRAWYNGECHIPDEDADSRRYGEEGLKFGRWDQPMDA